MKRDHAAPREREAAAESLFRPLDYRRIREIRKWFEGNRRDAPTPEELHEFIAWVSGEIEVGLARHQPVRDLVGYLNAARAELHAAGHPV
jgi:hypothetical protein